MDSAPPTQPCPSTDPPFSEGDPRFVFAKAVGVGSAVIAGVRPEQLHLATPCHEFDVRGLVGHLIGVLRRVAAAGRGEDVLGVPAAADDVTDDVLERAWSEAAHEVQAAWADDAVLARTVRVPWGEVPGAAALATWTNEVTVHTWDLATATGQHPTWDYHVLEVAYRAARQTLPIETGRPDLFKKFGLSSPPFADAVAVPADAPLIDRLVAWNGRHP